MSASSDVASGSVDNATLVSSSQVRGHVPHCQHSAVVLHRVLGTLVQFSSVLGPADHVIMLCLVRAVQLHVVQTVKLDSDVARCHARLCNTSSAQRCADKVNTNVNLI